MKTSVIQHREHYFIVIRETYLQLTSGNECAAALLSLYEHRHNGLVENQSENLYQKCSNKFLQKCMLDVYSENTIRKANALLIEMGLIEIVPTNTQTGGTGSNYVLFNVEKVQKMLDERAERGSSNLQGTPQNCGGALLKFAQHNKIIKQDNSSSFLEKKNQKRSDVNAVQKTAFDDAEKQIYTAKEQQSEAQKEKEKSCAKKEKEAKHTHPKKRERFTALPSDEEEFKAKIISLLPRHFTVKMKDAFLEYMIYRRKRRKLGDLDSVKRQINKVADWSEAELVQSVDDTIAHAWQGLFLPKISSKYKQDQKISFNHIQQQASRQNHEMLKQLNAFDDLNNLPI